MFKISPSFNTFNLNNVKKFQMLVYSLPNESNLSYGSAQFNAESKRTYYLK